MKLDDMVKLIEAENPIEATAEFDNLRQVDKGWTTQEAVRSSLDDFEIIEGQNKYTIEHESVPFEFLFLPSAEKKLYVLLSSARLHFRRTYPAFMRWKYQNFFKGNILCVDDPMYYFHPDTYGAAWFYGTEDVSYVALLVDIIKKFMKQLNIEADQVVFLGSSAGGTAALYCANLLDNSAAIASNPQFELKDLHSQITADFKKIGLDLYEQDKLNRNHMTLTNPKSRYAIAMNARSEEEYETQFVPFFERQKITPKFGITVHDNIITWIHSTKYWDTHKVIPGEVSLALMDFLLEKLRNNEDVNEITNLSILANQTLADIWDLKWQNENLTAERDAAYKFFIKNISDYICETLTRKIPKNMSTDLRKFVDYDYDISHIARNTGFSDYCIGAQRIYRYNIFYLKGKFYFRIKFSDYASHFSKKEELDKYLESIMGQKIQKCFVDATGALVVGVELNPENAEKQIADFIDLSLDFLQAYL